MERLLTVKQTAEYLGRTQQSMRWMIHAGTAPKSAMIGGRRMFRESDVNAFVARAFDGDNAALAAPSNVTVAR